MVLNEGLRRWRVEYYLAIIQRQGRGITVAFDVSRTAPWFPTGMHVDHTR